METALAEYLIHAPVFVRTVPGVITHWTTGAAELYGFTWEEAQGRSSHELLDTVFPEPLDAIDGALLEQGRWEGLLSHTKSDGSRIWTQSVWRLKRSSHGEEARVVEMNTDVTQRELLARELDHRVKNTLAVVQGMARGSFQDSDAADVRRFERRLIALGHAHDLLLRNFWLRAKLEDVLAGVLGPLGVQDRVDVQGPSVDLPPTSVVAYSLVFHELATNALKHGALSNDAGRVRVSWALMGERRDRIHLVWRESGGPEVTAPSSGGFGSALISRALAAELGRSVDLRFEPEGLVCAFDAVVQSPAAA